MGGRACLSSQRTFRSVKPQYGLALITKGPVLHAHFRGPGQLKVIPPPGVTERWTMHASASLHRWFVLGAEYVKHEMSRAHK